MWSYLNVGLYHLPFNYFVSSPWCTTSRSLELGNITSRNLKRQSVQQKSDSGARNLWQGEVLKSKEPVKTLNPFPKNLSTFFWLVFFVWFGKNAGWQIPCFKVFSLKLDKKTEQKEVLYCWHRASIIEHNAFQYYYSYCLDDRRFTYN